MRPSLAPNQPKTNHRGYGYRHQQLRRRWAPKVAAGTVRCARCGDLIQPGQQWDLGHDDDDRTKYAGPEHSQCNRATSGRQRQSRRW